MKKLIIIGLLALLTHYPAYAGHLSLDQLLQEIKKNQSQETRINQAREAEFLAAKNKQEELLQAAVYEKQKQEKLSRELKAHLDETEQELAELETELKQRSGDLSELFSIAKQAAGDLKADLEHSIISAQFPDRMQTIKGLIDSKSLPNIQQLEELWFILQHEMTESGKVVSFDSSIETASGTPIDAKVFRIGTFNVLTEQGYLQYSADNGRLTLLARQPSNQYLSLIDDLTSDQTDQVDVGIDPTRGVILSMLIQAPNTIERIQQGGLIGYIILAMGAGGLVFALFKLALLAGTGRKMQNQLTSEQISTDNPLGRVLEMAEQHQNKSLENLELVLDEAITREIPLLEKGVSMIKLLAAVAPLLGLLGTVTGMIATFQSISLFGTGDPKLMANGISQALVTTMLGLCVAIPLLFLHSLVASRSRILIQILDEQTAGIISRRSER